MDVADQLGEGDIRNELLEKAVDVMQGYLTTPRYDHDISRHIVLCLDALEARFGIQAERELHKRLGGLDSVRDCGGAVAKRLRLKAVERRLSSGQVANPAAPVFSGATPTGRKNRQCLERWETRVQIMDK